MIIEFEVNEKELKQLVMDQVVKEMAASIIKHSYIDSEFAKAIRYAARKAVEENMERLERLAVAYAGDKIARNCDGCPLAKGSVYNG